MPSRREFLQLGTALAMQEASSPGIEEVSLVQLQEGLVTSRWTSVLLVEAYLARINRLDRQGPRINALIELNPDARLIAAGLDRERKERGARGPLHGIPVVIKDNIETGDKMMTSAGSLALADEPARMDAELVTRLRTAGAVILGKTNPSEWAGFRSSSNSTSGWSGRGGQTRNPYALDRSPSGSSSGSAAAVAASLCAVAVGTETDGSIVSPCSVNGLVGIKPTVGLIPSKGIVPISRRQDTAGPMARSVADAALLLGVLVGASYGQALQSGGLRGARLGVARQLFGLNDHVDRLMESVLEVLKRAGAEVIDPVTIPTYPGLADLESEALLWEFKADLNAYLEARGGAVRSLKDVIDFNDRNPSREMQYFGQDILIKAAAKGSLNSKAYRDLLARLNRAVFRDGLDAVVARHKLDALVAPTDSPAWPIDYIGGDHAVAGSSTMAAIAGYPHVTVPAGHVFGLPVGLSFFGSARTEVKLIRYAFAFEQAVRARRAPEYLPSVTFL